MLEERITTQRKSNTLLHTNFKNRWRTYLVYLSILNGGKLSMGRWLRGIESTNFQRVTTGFPYANLALAFFVRQCALKLRVRE